MTVADPTAQAFWFLDDLARIHLGAAAGDGHASLVEFWSPPGDMPPLHRHRREGELFYVLSGRLALHQPGRRVEITAGGSHFLECGVPHAYEVLGPDIARFLVLATPAGFDAFVAEVGREAARPGLPDPSEPDPGALAEVAARYGIELLGPPGTIP